MIILAGTGNRSSGDIISEPVAPDSDCTIDQFKLPPCSRNLLLPNLAGVADAASARKRTGALKNRPKLLAQLAEKYPELYGPDAKLPPEKPKKKTK